MLHLIMQLGWVFEGLAGVGAAYAVAAALLAGHFTKPRRRPAAAVVPVTLLKPLYRNEPDLAANLESFFVQDYAAPVQIVFGVHDAGDPAAMVVAQLRTKYPDADTRLVVDGRLHGVNGKISNLVNMLPAARHDVLVLSDGDIAVGPDWLRTVTGALEEPGVGVVTCLYTGKAQRADDSGARLWSRLSAMGTSYEFLPKVLVGIALQLAAPCFGSTIAIKRRVLAEIGGFQAFSGALADDYEIGRATRARGYRVAIPALCVSHTAHEESAETLWRHELRWTRTIRTINRVGHLGSIVTLGLPLALVGAVFLHFSVASLGVLGIVLAARLFLKMRIDAVFGHKAGPAWLLPLRDLLSFAVFLGSLSGETVHWRGARFEVEPGGAMTETGIS